MLHFAQNASYEFYYMTYNLYNVQKMYTKWMMSLSVAKCSGSAR